MRHVAAVMVCLSFPILTLAQDAEWVPPAAPEGWKAVASKDGRYRVAFPANWRLEFTPRVMLSTPEGQKRVPTPESFREYSIKLTVGPKEKDGSISGTICLCTPDTGRSFFAGKFTAKEK